MVTAAYRDRSSGAYPISADQVRSRSMMLYGDDPPAAALDSANVDPVQASEPPGYDPATQTVAEGPPAKQGGKWWQTWTVVDLPPPPPVKLVTYKADVWRRVMNEPDKAAIIDTELTKLNVVMRRLWDDASYLDHASPEFPTLKAAMVAAFGESEAARILAPSDV